MSTKLGDVSLTIKLDISEAERQLSLLEGRLIGLASPGPGMPEQKGISQAAKGPGWFRQRYGRQPMTRARRQDVADGEDSPQGEGLGSQLLRRGYTTYSIMQGIQSPLDLGISAISAIPVVGGGLAFGAQAARMVGTVGAPIAKGMIEGMLGTDQLPLAAQEIIQKTVLNNLDAIAQLIAKTEAWNEAVKPTLEKMIQMAALSAIASQGKEPTKPQDLVGYGMMVFQEQAAVNELNRRFRQWRLELGGESVGRAITGVMVDSHKQQMTR